MANSIIGAGIIGLPFSFKEAVSWKLGNKKGDVVGQGVVVVVVVVLYSAVAGPSSYILII